MRIGRLVKHIIPAIAFIFACLTQANLYAAQSEPILFQYEVNAGNINLRSDSTVNSEVICLLDKGQRVEVASELYGWYKIKLPKTVPCYIKKDMVECAVASVISSPETPCKDAKVSKSRVNIRLYPSESALIVGIADKGEAIKVLKEEGGWYKIEPTANSFGWVNKSFINSIPVKGKKAK